MRVSPQCTPVDPAGPGLHLFLPACLFGSASCLCPPALHRLRDPRTCRDKDRGGNKGGRRAAKIRTTSREDAVLACAQVGLAPSSARVSWPKDQCLPVVLTVQSMRAPLSLLLSAYLLSCLYGACRVMIALGADCSILPVAFNQSACMDDGPHAAPCPAPVHVLAAPPCL